MNLSVMKYKCPIPATWNLVELTYAVETFGLLNCTCSYGMTLCRCSGTPSMSLSCGLGLPKFFSQLPSDRAANWNSTAAHSTSHQDMVTAVNGALTETHTHGGVRRLGVLRSPHRYIIFSTDNGAERSQPTRRGE